MPLQRRLMKVTFDMPQGQPPLVLDQELELNVAVHKNCLQVQSTAEVEVFNLTTTRRAYMLSNFTEWNARQIQQMGKSPDVYVNVTIEAGYDSGQNAASSVLFNGQVVTTSLISTPPNLGMKFNCASRQIDKTKDVVGPPNSATFRDYVAWAAGVMGINFVCQTSFDSAVVKNGFNSISDVSALIMAIQAMYQPHIVAYVDNQTLYVRDTNRPFANEHTIPINEFIGAPSMTSFGATFRTLLNTSVHLGGLVDIQSQMNPALAIGKPFIVYKLDYSLSSRQTDFYMNAEVYPEAT